jgi:DNA-binding CsgD family transcriptional regulator
MKPWNTKEQFEFGGIWVILGRSNKIASFLLAGRGGRPVKEAREQFTARELEILKLLGQGKTSKEIAVLLNVSVTTVASHRKNLCRKLGAHSTAELISLCCNGSGLLFTLKLGNELRAPASSASTKEAPAEPQ